MIRAARFLVLSFALAALGLGLAHTAPVKGFGRGRGTVNPGHCKQCFPGPDADRCTFIVCDNHWCIYDCLTSDGTDRLIWWSRQHH